MNNNNKNIIIFYAYWIFKRVVYGFLVKTSFPKRIVHFLEVLGFNWCIDIYDTQEEMTPYFLKRKNLLLEKKLKFFYSISQVGQQ